MNSLRIDSKSKSDNSQTPQTSASQFQFTPGIEQKSTYVPTNDENQFQIQPCSLNGYAEETAPSFRWNDSQHTKFSGLSAINYKNLIAPSRSNNAEEQQLSERFVEKEQKVFFRSQRTGELILLADFHIRVQKIIHRKSSTGVEILILVNLQSARTEIPVTEIEIPREKFHTLYKEIKRNPEYRISAIKNDQSFFEEYAQIVYRNSLDNLPISVEYSLAGWTDEISPEYMHSGIANCIANRQLALISSNEERQVVLDGLKFLKIGDLKKTLPIFLFAHLGIMAKLFEEAGLPIQFLLLIHGKTGSFKTAVSKLIFQVFKNDSLVNFTWTAAALEKERENSQDLVFLLDDIFQATDKQTLAKLEGILRPYGDGAPRGKIDATTKTISTVPLRSCAAVTAEAVPTSQLSSQLRMLKLEVDHQSFNSHHLKFFQEDQRIAKFQRSPNSYLEKYFSVFIKFLESNYRSTVQNIADFSTMSLEAASNISPRLVSTYRILLSTINTVLKLAIWAESISAEQAIQLKQHWESIVWELIVLNQIQSQTYDPALRYLMAINHGYNSSQLNIAPNKEAFFSSPIYHGFMKNSDILVLEPKTVLKFVENFSLSEFKTPFTTNKKDLYPRLNQLEVWAEIEQDSSRTAPRYEKRVADSNSKKRLPMLHFFIEKINNLTQHHQGGNSYE